MVTVSSANFFFCSGHHTRSHIISSPGATNTTTVRVIPIPNCNSATSPHTPRLCGNSRSSTVSPKIDAYSCRPPCVCLHPVPAPSPVLVLILAAFLLFLLLVRPSRGYTPTPCLHLTAAGTPLRSCPFNFYSSLAPSPHPLLAPGKNADNRRGDSPPNSLLAPRSELEHQRHEAHLESGVFSKHFSCSIRNSIDLSSVSGFLCLTVAPSGMRAQACVSRHH